MNILEGMKELENDILMCVKCGLCQSVCPVFQELGKESSVARGKIALVEALTEGSLEITSTVSEWIECCLLCGKCVEDCPSGVRVDLILLRTRAISTELKGLSFTKRLILRVFLKNPWLFHIGLKAASVFQKMLFRPTGLDRIHKARLSIGLDRRRNVLPLARKAVRERWPEVISPEIFAGRVALFTGCITNSILTGIGDAAIRVLLKHNIETIIPKDQSCCGMIAMAMGDEATFTTLAKRNLKAFSSMKVDGIITTCATCGYTLKYLYSEFLRNESQDVRHMAKMVSDQTYDICEYIVNQLEAKKVTHHEIHSPSNGIVVTCHDPCHLKRKQGIYHKQRKFIDLIEGITLKEMSTPDRCCGGGGSFSLSYYDLSLQILNKKVDDIEKTNADIVLTSCAGCHMQLVDGLAQRSSPIKVRHPIELYEEA